MFVAAITVIFAALFFGCNGEITSLEAKNETVTMKPGQTIDIRTLVEKKGNGDLAYSVENPDVLTIKGNTLVALNEGEGSLIVASDKFTVRIKVIVSKGVRVKLVFSDTTAVYDGSAFFIGPTGVIPKGTSIKYTCGGKEFNGAIDAGTYEVTAEVTLPDGYILECDDLTAVLTVEKARYDMSGVSFPSRVLRYNGTNQVVSVSGTLPEGVSVTYENNVAKAVGEYVATATFHGSDKNYEEIGSLSCKYTIEKGMILLSDYGINVIDKVYDGEKVVAGAKGLPYGAKIVFYDKKENGDDYTERTAAPEFIDAGSYEYYARIFADDDAVNNYAFATDHEILTFDKLADGKNASKYFRIPVRIKKADLESGSLVLRDGNGNSINEIVYGRELTVGSGAAYAVKIENGSPNGVKNEFNGRYTIEYEIKRGEQLVNLNDFGGVLNVGKYEITATYVMPSGYDKNYNAPKTPYLTLTVKQAKYDVRKLKFAQVATEKTYDGKESEFFLEEADEKLEVTYSIKRNGKIADAVLHAGNYEIRAEFAFKDVKLGNNYEKIPALIKTFEVKPDTVELDGVSFNAVSKTYDGKGIIPEITLEKGKTLPDDVSVKYFDKSGNELSEPIVNAGKYSITAVFYYNKGNNEKGDFKFVIGTNEVTELSANFVINKAKYTASDFDEKQVKTEEGKTYRYGMTLKEIAFTGYKADKIKWTYPGEKIGELALVYEGDAATIKGRKFVAEALFNDDEKNYEDYAFKATIYLNPMQLDLTGTTVPDQFIAQKGTTEDVKVHFGSTVYENELIKTVAFSAEGKATVKLVPEKKNNYVVIGQSEFTGVKIYIYNPDEFTFIAGTTVMTKYKGNLTDVVIPYGTTEMASRMFENSYVTSLVIPESVVVIPKHAFFGMTSLDQISFSSLDALNGNKFTDAFGSSKPTSLKVVVSDDDVIAENVFYGANYVKETEYKKKISSIGKDAFSGCTSLTAIKADLTEIKSIGERAFKGCVKLETLVLPSLVGDVGQAVTLRYYFDTSIVNASLKVVSLISKNDFALENNAFTGASKIEKITLKEGLISIGASAFKGVKATVDLSATSVREIADYAFANYSGNEVVLPSNLTKIGSFAFTETKNLFASDGQTFVVPRTVGFIGRRAFYNSKINEIEFERNSAYKEVEDETFFGFSGKKIALPNSVTVLGKKAFASTTAESISIGTAVTHIGDNCFDGGSGKTAKFTSFIIPDKVDRIGANAFLNCPELIKITFESLLPPTQPASTVFATGGAVITFVIKNGANKDKYKEYFERCGISTDRYRISNLL